MLNGQFAQSEQKMYQRYRRADIRVRGAKSTEWLPKLDLYKTVCSSQQGHAIQSF